MKFEPAPWTGVPEACEEDPDIKSAILRGHELLDEGCDWDPDALEVLLREGHGWGAIMVATSVLLGIGPARAKMMIFESPAFQEVRPAVEHLHNELSDMIESEWDQNQKTDP